MEWKRVEWLDLHGPSVRRADTRMNSYGFGEGLIGNAFVRASELLCVMCVPLDHYIKGLFNINLMVNVHIANWKIWILFSLYKVFSSWLLSDYSEKTKKEKKTANWMSCKLTWTIRYCEGEKKGDGLSHKHINSRSWFLKHIKQMTLCNLLKLIKYTLIMCLGSKNGK